MKISTTPYQTRPIRFLELWQPDDWKIKVYGIASGRPEPRDELVHAAKTVAAERIAEMPPTMTHYSVGFLGVHDGLTSNFVFIDWWADENELHHHVYKSPCDDLGQLTCTTPTGVIACVWDLRLIAFEREAWLETVLKSDGDADPDAYLLRRLNEDV